ncbi:MAG TPA: hypothetical protein VGK25_00300 [Ignavibacteria bacterium]
MGFDYNNIRKNGETLIELITNYENCHKKAEHKLSGKPEKKPSEANCKTEMNSLFDFFRKLSYKEIIELLCIMCGGRDYALVNTSKKIVSFAEQYNSFDGHEKQLAISSLTEKNGLSVYLKEGMKYFRI